MFKIEMTMNKLYIALAAILTTSVASAQQDSVKTIERDVDVVNTYLPTISNPFKLQVDPVADDTMSYHPTFTYETLNKVQMVKTTPDSLSAAAMNFKPEETMNRAWVRAGAGNYANFLGQFIYNIGQASKNHLNVDLGHHSMLGKVKLYENNEKVKAPTSKTWVKADYATFFKNNIFSANAQFNNHSYRYYGYQTVIDTARYYADNGNLVPGNELTDGEKQRQTTFDLNLGFGNGKVDPREGVGYNIKAGFGIFGNATGLHEVDVNAKGYFRIPMKKNYLFDGSVEVNVNNINTPDYEGNAYVFNERKHTDIQLMPHFGIDHDFFQLRAGINFILEFGGKEDALFLQPDIFADFNISDGAVTLYTGMTGGYKANTFRQLVLENPYISSDASNYVWKAMENTFELTEMQTTQNPIRLTAGLRAKVGNKVAFDLGIDYASFDDEMFFINKGYLAQDSVSYGYTNMFGLISENGKLFKTKGELNITPSSRTQILLKGVYYSWKLDYLEEPWYKPTYEFGVDLRFYPIERLLVTTGVNATSCRYGYNQTTRQKEKLKSLVDINLSGEYRINSQWTAFLNINNVAAQDYQKWIGYSSHRLNVLAGVTFKF